MQLDKTRVAIRERPFLDILDLALCVVRRFSWPLAGVWLLDVVPAMGLNAWVVSYVPGECDEPGFVMLCMLLLAGLVWWQTPLVTAPLTLYLGHAVFTDKPDPRRIAREFASSLGQLVAYQVLARPVLATWPYLNEVILLERNPMVRVAGGQKSTWRRCGELHGPMADELLVRGLLSMGIALGLTAALWLSVVLVRGLLLSEPEWTRAVFTFWFQMSLWLVAGYFTVVRFLSYLDLRIRREGWEVELALRAEGARLSGLS